jgi:hypothetical protein
MNVAVLGNAGEFSMSADTGTVAGATGSLATPLKGFSRTATGDSDIKVASLLEVLLEVATVDEAAANTGAPEEPWNAASNVAFANNGLFAAEDFDAAAAGPVMLPREEGVARAAGGAALEAGKGTPKATRA